MTFTPNDTANYETIAAGAVNVAVGEAVPTVITIKMQGNDVLLQWQGTNLWSYTVEKTTSLLTVPWTDLAGSVDIPGTNAMMSTVDSNVTDAVKFYRLIMTP